MDGCRRPEELVGGRSAGGYCAGHRHRKKLLAKGRLKVPFESPIHDGLARLRSPRRALLEAALSLLDETDSDDATVARRPMERLTHAALVYAKAVRKGKRR